MSATNTKREKDIFRMIQSNCHIGSRNFNIQMKRYIHSVDHSGVPVFKVDETYEKIQLAARIIAGISDIKDVYAISSRKAGQRAVIKFASNLGASCEPSLRWTPGSLTNYKTKNFKEPELIIVADPYSDFKAIKEASYCNIPVIALCDTMSNLKFVDLAIPCNNRKTESIGMIFWLLAKEVKILKGQLNQDEDWDVRVELFYDNSNKLKEKAIEQAAVAEEDSEAEEADEADKADADNFDEANN